VDCEPDIPVHFSKRAESIPVCACSESVSDAIKVSPQIILIAHSKAHTIYFLRAAIPGDAGTSGPHGNSSLNPLAAISCIYQSTADYS
jgi:hypothetical protein